MCKVWKEQLVRQRFFQPHLFTQITISTNSVISNIKINIFYISMTIAQLVNLVKVRLADFVLLKEEYNLL